MELEIYETSFGKRPFEMWVEDLRDRLIRTKIFIRLDRLTLGNFGDCKSVGEGVCELRIHYGPGIRVYYANVDSKVVLLLCGGDKGSQTRDINKAKEYLRDYESRERQFKQIEFPSRARVVI